MLSGDAYVNLPLSPSSKPRPNTDALVDQTRRQEEPALSDTATKFDAASVAFKETSHSSLPCDPIGLWQDKSAQQG